MWCCCVVYKTAKIKSYIKPWKHASHQLLELLIILQQQQQQLYLQLQQATIILSMWNYSICLNDVPLLANIHDTLINNREAYIQTQQLQYSTLLQKCITAQTHTTVVTINPAPANPESGHFWKSSQVQLRANS